MSLRCDNCKDETRQCPECRKLARQIRFKGEKYKAAKKAYDQSEKARIAGKAYERSEAGKRTRSKYDKKRSQTEAYKQWRREYDRKKRAANVEKEKAHAYVNFRVRSGQIPPAASMTCKDCGQPAAEYHHESYERERWLDVIPLCKQCHVNRHPKPTPAQGDNYERYDFIQGAK